jgi:diacylglycerol kinase family enzyme
MMRRRRQKETHVHYCLLVNRRAAAYNPRPIKELITAIRNAGWYFTIYESESVEELAQKAQVACGVKRRHRQLPEYLQQRGKVTALVACGGDGTVNLAAGIALAADLPLGVLPMGRFNNIARSLYDSVDTGDIIELIIKRGYRRIDTATVSGRLVVGSLGVGLIPAMAHLLQEKKIPRFGFLWSQLSAKAASQVRMKKMVIKVDSFRFELRPTLFNINLLTYSVGLPLSPVSVFDDRQVETIFDIGRNGKELSTLVRQVWKKKYVYGSEVRMFRGKTVTFQPVKGQTVYIDGELVELPSNTAELQLSEKQLKVFC